MTDWVTVALSGGSVCVGAGLTMLGQYFADRRSYVREREARREGFRITNYEIQRTALLELQEIVVKLGNTLTGISFETKFQDLVNLLPGNFQAKKITQWHQYHRLQPEITSKLSEGYRLMEESVQPHELPKERRQEISSRLKELAKEFGGMPESLEPLMRTIGEVADITERIKILAPRTGSGATFTCSRNLMEMVDAWSSAESLEKSDLMIREVKQQIERTLDAIGDALRLGPFY